MSALKIVKVELKLSDGSIDTLVGEDAEKWQTACNAQAAFCAAHGLMFPKLTWQTSKPMTIQSMPEDKNYTGKKG